MFEKISFHVIRPALMTGVFLLLTLLLLCPSPAPGESAVFDPPADWVIEEDTTYDIQVHPTKDIVITIPEGVTLTTNASLTGGTDHSITVQGKGTLVAHGHDDDHNIYGIFCDSLILKDGITVKAFGARSTDGYSHAVYAANITLRDGATLYAWGGSSSSGIGGNGISFFGYYPPYTLTLDASAVLQSSGGLSSDGTHAAAFDTFGFGAFKYPLTIINAVSGQAWTDIAGTEGETEIEVSSAGQTWSDLTGTTLYPLVEFGIHHHYFEVTHTDSTLTLRCKKCSTTYTAELSDPSKTYDGAPAEAVLTLSSDFTKEYTFGHPVYFDADGNELSSAPVSAGAYTVKVPVGYLGELQFNLSVPFTVSRAVPVILKAPSAESMVEGECLADSILSDGKASVEGAFTWEDPTIVPALSDSETTAYTVLFTPADSDNYTGASVTLTVTVVAKEEETVELEPVDPPLHLHHDHQTLAFETVGEPVENVLPLLTEIKVDGETLAEKDYVLVEAEHPVLVLSEEFLDTLSSGTHVVEEDFGTDLAATASFTVAEEKVTIEAVDTATHLIHDHHTLSFETAGDPVEEVMTLLSEVKVDGQTLSEEDYTVVEAETPVLVLSEEFLDTLSTGTHVLEEDFGTDLAVATASFTVVEEKVTIEPVDTTTHVIHDHHDLAFETVGDPVEEVMTLLTDVQVDGHSLSASDYTVVEAETPVLVLNEEFLDTLSPGTHVLEEDFGKDLAVATISFTVKAEKPVPKTGDSASPLLWLGLTLLSLTALLLLRKKSKS